MEMAEDDLLVDASDRIAKFIRWKAPIQPQEA